MLMLNNPNPEQWEKLFNIIGYRFNDKKLCLQLLLIDHMVVKIMRD